MEYAILILVIGGLLSVGRIAAESALALSKSLDLLNETLREDPEPKEPEPVLGEPGSWVFQDLFKPEPTEPHDILEEIPTGTELGDELQAEIDGTPEGTTRFTVCPGWDEDDEKAADEEAVHTERVKRLLRSL